MGINNPIMEVFIKAAFEEVNSRIWNAQIARQFVLEEIEAASTGNDDAKTFVKESGFSEREYKGAMRNSCDAVDGANGPQQTLLEFTWSLTNIFDMDSIVKIRIEVVKRIMRQWKLCAEDNRYLFF
ncbi:MAG: hypothetical protein LBT96_02075 [Campylobacteraceae bacterium]|jgi:hypothetical protein|nr:hypothetical protein [Campylobacteraceae bacterium]